MRDDRQREVQKLANYESDRLLGYISKNYFEVKRPKMSTNMIFTVLEKINLMAVASSLEEHLKNVTPDNGLVVMLEEQNFQEDMKVQFEQTIMDLSRSLYVVNTGDYFFEKPASSYSYKEREKIINIIDGLGEYLGKNMLDLTENLGTRRFE